MSAYNKGVVREFAMDSSHALSQALNSWMTEFGPSGIFRTCENCKNMEANGPAYCSLFSATPPVAVIMKGCDEHEDVTDIPF